MEERIIHIIKQTLNHLKKIKSVETLHEASLQSLEISVEKPRREEYGDLATNIAFMLAPVLKMKPIDIAEIIVKEIIDKENLLESAVVAPPGFINFRIRSEEYLNFLGKVQKEKGNFGNSSYGKGRKILIEFVSANPTGPLHVGHGRGAVIGDTLAEILKKVGFDVHREYYINDVGNQMSMLGLSVFKRYKESLGMQVDFPENGYQGNYIKEIGEQMAKALGNIYASREYEEQFSERDRNIFCLKAAEQLSEKIKEDLSFLGITFDNWFSERTLYESGEVNECINKLKENEMIYSDGSTLKFRTTNYGDTEDRVVVRENGIPTYFASDIAYHENKFRRGFETLINVWGADHHGYIPRMKAAVSALMHDPDKLKIILVQMVTLLRNGEPVSMGKRSGEYITLRDVIDEVGRDAVRFFFLMRRPDAQLEFDLDLAKKQNLDNPVYYVQYGHARVCSILRKGSERGFSVPDFTEDLVKNLSLPEELRIVKQISSFPYIILRSALSYEPHHILFYLIELCGEFHSYYTKYKHTEKVLSPENEKTKARLILTDCVRITLNNGLRLLGVDAPERMFLMDEVSDE